MSAATTAAPAAVAATEPAAIDAAQRLKLTEIFLSVQGESTLAGLPTVFVRLTGCPLRCQYCDTAYAFHGGAWHSFAAVEARIGELGAQQVCITGGEPLAQRNVLPFMARLCDAGYTVSLETSGAMDVTGVDPRVIKVLDLKTPDSGEQHRNRLDNLAQLNTHDQVKFVVCSRRDFDWAAALTREHGLEERVTVLFSPSFGQVAPAELADWFLASGVRGRLQMQLHKLIWGEEPGR